jgi:hypothetical protein
MAQSATFRWIAVAALILVPGLAHAGPPLLCHPFQVSGTPMLPWAGGPDWNSPDAGYDRTRLVADTLRVLDDRAPILDRMENIRRAVLYATRDTALAERLLAAVQARAETGAASRLALFDAGYLIETLKQAAHLMDRPVTQVAGYPLVLRALQMGPEVPEMEFAAALMSEGPRFSAHLDRAKGGMRRDSLLARNVRTMGW